MQFHFHANQSHFHKNGFALKLALKQRHEGTRKWSINFLAMNNCTRQTGRVSELGYALARHLKPRPNDRNISTQHFATLLGATCCARLATVLRCVATCWVLLAQI